VAAIDQILEDAETEGRRSRPRETDLQANARRARLDARLQDRGGLRAVPKAASTKYLCQFAHLPGDAHANFGEAMVIVGVECRAHYLAMDRPLIQLLE
jgi:hypothetical protein